MAEPRRRRKAVIGLEKIPATEQEWWDMAMRFRLGNSRLQDICSYGISSSASHVYMVRLLTSVTRIGRFSASTVPTEAFLTIRCIWPAARNLLAAEEHILATNSFFNEKHLSMATNMIDEGALGLDKLGTLFDIICSEPAKTPQKWTCTAGTGLGPFSMLVSLKSQIMAKLLHTTKDETSTAYPITYAPKREDYYDAFHQFHSVEVPDSPTPKGPKRPRLQPPDEGDQASSQHTTSELELEMETEGDLAEAIQDAIPDEISEPRTPTETLIVDFMVNLFGGIACMIQPLASHIICIANAFETTYSFGPVRDTTGRSTIDDETQFRARIDGSIPYSLSHGNLPEMVIFEAKRMARTNTARSSVAVMGQQSMEHIAYI